MVKLKRQVIGLEQLQAKLQKVARSVSPQGHLADGLAAGADQILESARENLLEQGLFLSGDLYDSGKVVKVNQYRVDVEFDKVYAAIHEYGGTIEVTDKARAYFWYRFAKTGDPMWRALALSDTITIPARPYLRPALEENKGTVSEFVAKALRPYVRRAAT